MSSIEEGPQDFPHYLQLTQICEKRNGSQAVTGFEQDGPTISSGVLRPIGMGHDYLRVKESTEIYSLFESPRRIKMDGRNQIGSPTRFKAPI